MSTTADFHIQQGKLLMRQGQLDEARSLFHEALQLEPESADAHANLGNVFAYQKRYDEAIAHYRHALRLNPTCSRCITSWGWHFTTWATSSKRNSSSARRSGSIPTMPMPTRA